MNRRSFLRSAPVAVAAAPMAAQKVAEKFSAGGIIGSANLSNTAGIYPAPEIIYPAPEMSPSEWVPRELKSLAATRSRVLKQEAELLENHMAIQIEGARLDGMRSLSQSARIRHLAEWNARRNAQQELRWIDERIKSITDQHPFAAGVAKALGLISE